MSIHNEENYPPSEWSATRIAIRICMYLLCSLLLALAVYWLLDDKPKDWKAWRSILGILGFCTAYIIIDIRVIIVHGRKRREFKKKFPTSED